MENAITAAKTLRYQELADRTADLIRQGTYPPGKRLPSVRETSRQQGVSISTVLQAYSVLESQGLIESRPQSGYYVCSQRLARLPEPDISAPGRDPSQVSLHELIMMLLADTINPDLIQLGTAMPNPDLLPMKKINRIIVDLAREDDARLHQYRFPPGTKSLRTQVAQRAVVSGCSLSPNDIVITSGGTEAMDICLHAACRPGDIVAVESPTYFGILQTLEIHGLRALEIPTHPRDGISLEALAFAIDHNPIRAVMIMPNFNNPLGCLIPDEKKKELVELLERHDIPLIENDVSGEIYFGGKRPMVCKAFDTKGLVMLFSSFSKDISPALRIGWVAPGRFLAEVEWLKFTISAAAPTLGQRVVTRFLESGGYEPHLRRIRREYARNVDLLSTAVMRHFPAGTRLTRPSGGQVLWVRLPENVDSLELYRRARQAGITLAPGYVFSPTQQFPNFIRLNAAEFNYSTERAVERLGGMIQDIAEL